MNIIDLIQSNQNFKESEERIKSLENQIGTKLPPIFRAFILNFNYDHILDDKLLCYYNEKYSTTLQMYEAEYVTDKRIAFHNFWKLEKIIPNMKSIYNQEGDDKIEIEKYIGLGECSNQGIILLGISEANIDQIFIEYNVQEPRIKKVENNIFEFLRNYRIELSQIDLPGESNKESLYRNWNENFWRIKN